MGNGSTFLISFLLAGFVCAFVVEGADRCNFNVSIPCFEHRADQRMTVERLLSFFRRGNISNGCSNFDKLKDCVKDKTRDCDPDEKNPFKKIWVKMQDSVNHVCVKNLQAFNDNIDCLSKQDLSTAVHTCETADHHRRYARHTCSEYQEGVKCVNDAIHNHCPDSKNIMDRLVRNTLSMIDIDHDCEHGSSGEQRSSGEHGSSDEHGSSGRRTEGSFVVRFILCTASFMLASLLN